MTAFRPLPRSPSLEFERKEAKALLRRLRAGDPEALSRARERHAEIGEMAPANIKLAHAQLVIAREYGFASWPRLVQYFGDVERQRQTPRTVQGDPDQQHRWVRTLLAEHRDRRMWTARLLASSVPRFYGMCVSDLFDATVTEDDARQATARLRGCATWEVLLERSAEAKPEHPDRWHLNPRQLASKAMAAADLDELRRVVAAHPELLHPSDHEAAKGASLLNTALHHEREKGRDAMRPIMDWLASLGLDVQAELNQQLCGRMHMETAKVRWLLERGADPNWIAPNGVPVLDHALVRYWNAEAVDLLAARTRPRKALWIAAGLGDVSGMSRFLDSAGKPTQAARHSRPPLDIGVSGMMPQHPDPDDEEILMEAFLVALLNGRTAVLEYMVSRGYPLDSLAWGAPMISIAIGNAWVPMVECLVKCGANLDLKGWRPHQTPREIARGMFGDDLRNADRRRIAELCGLDPEAIVAERDARYVNPPPFHPALTDTLELASDDAARLGHTEVAQENLLFGLLRGAKQPGGTLPLLYFTQAAGVDVDRFRAAVENRIHGSDDRVGGPALPLSADAEAAMQAAIGFAVERRRQSVQPLHLLHALLLDREGTAVKWLTKYGGDVSKVLSEIEKT